ncbi:MAG: DUF3187 family protein [Planctomycetes bacterium]|nr:DUF3187 family protein [Planctomycetota bacterium]
MRRRSSSAAVLLTAWLGACATTPRFDGPLAARNQHPAQLTVQRLAPRGASALAADDVELGWSNAYTSDFLAGTGGGDSFAMDGETLRTALRARIGLGEGFELGLELPFLHASGGFLDDFVVDWHAFFGFPDQGRDVAPRDAYRIRATRNGATAFELEQHGLHLGDVPIGLFHSLLAPSDAQPFGVGVAAGLELPTGDADAGFGNGGLDASLGLVLEARSGPIAWTAQLSHSFAANPDRARAAGLDFADVTALDLGAELALDDSLALLVTTQYESSTLRGLDLARASDPQWLLWVALRHRLGERTRLEYGLGEDLSSFVAPDFSAWIALTTSFGPSEPR